MVGSGQATGAAFGGTAWSAVVEGRVRLPLASPSSACEGCLLPDGKTLQVTGLVELSNLRASGENRMIASVGGDFSEVRFDEQSIAPALFGKAGLAVGAVAAVGVVAVLAKFLGTALLTRLKRDPLEHPKRQQIYAYIKEKPGATFREVARRTDTPTGTARHHLSMMKRHDLIVEHPHGATMRFFENHGKYDASWSRVVLLREEPLRQLHEWLAARPEAPQKDVLEAMASEFGWGRSTTQHRLTRLCEGGLAAVRLQGRLKFYAVRPNAAPRPAVGFVAVASSPTAATNA
ncbi:MAG: helix-turn-helix domain-containing protein [Candidatus Thermoplasmatota archaeon]